ncbi:GntR family transcriptional regulator [Arthrobacter sp. 35W]|uniref:GntR family transcriptional regulator n=1 Tax=Arthrobacter sp. 35W TaxID=1132441 RepID=UPI00040231CF|nr:GntR family transcriptional regulator [Arthrobacter sp. 35W]
MADTALSFLSAPLVSAPGMPLRVAAYSRIAQAIRTDLLRPGSLLPTETELGAHMKISRTVVREALMLLEEDGLVRARRGVGRFVADALPRHGIERVAPFDDIFRAPGQQIALHRVQTTRQPASEFVAPRVGLEPGEQSWLWESVLLRDGEPIAHLQEHIASNPEHDELLARQPDPAVGDARTLLAVLDSAGAGALDGECQIGLSTAGASRAALLLIDPADPVLVATQSLRRSGELFYLAKCVITAKAGHLSVMQSLQP